jgi:hypothetical protein
MPNGGFEIKIKAAAFFKKRNSGGRNNCAIFYCCGFGTGDFYAPEVDVSRMGGTVTLS